jgi:hypothetical protein
MSCAVERGRLLAYWLGELPEEDELALEEHLFECDGCAEAAKGLSSLIQALRARVPPTLTEDAIARLERQGLRLRHTRIHPGEHVVVPLGREDDMLVHRLQLDLAEIERLDCEVVNRADGTTLVTVNDLVFDRAAGEVNVVCQRHYVERFPPDAGLRLVVAAPGRRRVVAEYGVLHVLS